MQPNGQPHTEDEYQGALKTLRSMVTVNEYNVAPAESEPQPVSSNDLDFDPAQFRSYYDRSRQYISSMEQEVAHLRRSVRVLGEALQTLHSRYRETIWSIRREMGDVAKLNSTTQVAAVDKLKDEFSRAKRIYSSKNERLEQEIQTLQAELAAQKSVFDDAAVAASKELQQSSSKISLQPDNRNIASLNKEISQLKSAQAEAYTQIASSVSLVEQYEMKLSVLSAEKIQWEEKYRLLENRFDEYIRSFHEKMDSERSVVREESRKTIETLERKVRDLCEDNTALDTKLQIAQATAERTKNSPAAALAFHDNSSAQVSRLKTDLNRLRVEYEELVNENSQLREKLRLEQFSWEKQRDNFQLNVRSLDERMRNVSAELSSTNRECLQLIGENQHLKNKVEKLSSANSLKRAEAAESQVALLQSQLTKCQSLMRNQSALIQRLRFECRQLVHAQVA